MILEKSQAHIIADFIMKFPWEKWHNTVLVVVNMLFGIAHFVLTSEKTLVEGLMKLLRNYVWKLHELPDSIILDQCPQSVVLLMKKLNGMLEIKIKLLIAYHLQTNGQTK